MTPEPTETETEREMAREREDTGMHLPGLLSGGEARDEPAQERTGTSAPGRAKKSARRLLKLRRFLGKTVEKGASSAHGQIPSPF